MDAQQPVLGLANTRWNDCVGTVAADDAEALRDRPSLYDLAQIDRDRYTIVGIELTPAQQLADRARVNSPSGPTAARSPGVTASAGLADSPGRGWWLPPLVCVHNG